MNYYAWTALINCLVTILAALFVGLQHRGDRRRIAFVLFNLTTGIWCAPYVMWQLARTPEAALFWSRALMFGAFFIPATFLDFIVHLLKLERHRGQRHVIAAGYGVAAILCLGNFTSFVVRGVAPRLTFPFWPLPGPGFVIFTVYFFGYVTYAFGLLGWRYRVMSGAFKSQLRYLWIGTFVAFAGGSTNIPLWFDIPIPPVGNIGIPFYVVLATFAVIRHQFMDLRVAITRAGLLLATYLVVLGVPFVVGFSGRAWLERQLGAGWWMAPLGLCTALAAIGPFAYAFLRGQAEKRLLREQRRYQRLLQHAARGMTRVREVGRLAQLIARVVGRSVQIEHVTLLLWDPDRSTYVLAARHGVAPLATRNGLARLGELEAWLQTHRRVLTRDEAESSTRPALLQSLMDLDAHLVVPGFIQDQLVGFLMLGKKALGGSYSEDDLHAFATLANEAAMALENAKSYESLLKVNAELRTTHDQLLRQERLAAVGRFAAGMAHEIKNPLAAIKTFAEFLPERYDDREFRERFFRIVQSEIGRVTRIVHELLDFARPAPLQLQAVHIDQLLSDTIELLSNQCLKQGVEVAKAFDEDVSPIRADPHQLRQVFLNVLLNALEAMPNGGRLEIQAHRQDGQLRIRVSDTGCGIAEEQRAKLFDPFFTTKERGMGLGLAIVKGVVDRHGGTIRVSSTPGIGTRFEICLPHVLPVPRAAAPAEAAC
jgi:signal transduction histidine kinase